WIRATENQGTLGEIIGYRGIAVNRSITSSMWNVTTVLTIPSRNIRAASAKKETATMMLVYRNHRNWASINEKLSSGVLMPCVRSITAGRFYPLLNIL
ncbi:MAG: hypothetical protein WCF90_00695, partial [Methanomicrobiales archaeon]